MQEVNMLRQLNLYNSSHLLVSSLHVIADAGIPDAIHDGTAISAERLAAKANMNADALRRILRLLSGYEVFHEEPNGSFSHSKLSRLLRSDGPEHLRSMVHASKLSWRMAAALPAALRVGCTNAEAIEPSGLYDFLAENPHEARAFDLSMAARSAGDVGAILRAYNFSEFGVVADIGGGRGGLIQRILAAHPGVCGILYDLPRVIEDGAIQSSARLTMRAGDFFRDALPAANLYLLRNVIHNWEDSDAIRILQRLRVACGAMAKVLIMETLMPEGPSKDVNGPHPAILLDVYMLLGVGGRERTGAEYAILVSKAGYRIDKVIPTVGSVALLECTALP